MIDDSVPPRPAASPEDASDSLEQRVHELEALALDQGIVFNQEVIRLLASLQFLKAQPAVEYSGALLAAHDTADRYAHSTRRSVLPAVPHHATMLLSPGTCSSVRPPSRNAASPPRTPRLRRLRPTPRLARTTRWTSAIFAIVCSTPLVRSAVA